ncbi:PIN domain-containing protein [Kitasatospora sp. NPDC058048]|uniref:PIN domain-containing protein n=1 Tax=Kitasatospora sp. NPDC058048 TaxID=3346313 RepID=UPI0036DEB155
MDANILRGTKGGGAEDELLRTLRASKAERIAIPEIALEEVLAQRVLAYDRAHKAMREAAEKLNAATHWGEVEGPQEYLPEKVRDYWRSRYLQLAEVLETSIDVHRQALVREAGVIAPCKIVGTDTKTGARDAAIWLTAVEHARENPTETVYFISNNTRDFGNGVDWPTQLAEDIRGMESRFFLHTSLGGVLPRFARKVTTTVDEVTALLSDPGRLENIARRSRLAHLKEVIEALQLRQWRATHTRYTRDSHAALSEVTKPRAYEIDGQVWYTATARWVIAHGLPVQDGLRYDLQSWTTRVMVSAAAEPGSVTILSAGDFETAGADDAVHFPELAGSFFDGGGLLPNFNQHIATALSPLLRVAELLRGADTDITPFHGDVLGDGPEAQEE